MLFGVVDERVGTTKSRGQRSQDRVGKRCRQKGLEAVVMGERS